MWKGFSAWEIARYKDQWGVMTAWLICPLCSHGSVYDRNGKLYPPSSYGEQIQGLPSEVNDAYEEARNDMSIHAYTSCQLICRKILMHIAVDKCEAKEGDTFENYINAIATGGYITTPMKGWVNKIRDEGNDATHKLKPPSKTDAENIINFTTQLLRLVYEMEKISKQFNIPASDKS